MELKTNGRPDTVESEADGRSKTVARKSRRSAEALGRKTVRPPTPLVREAFGSAPAVARAPGPSKAPRRRSGKEMMVSHVVLMKPRTNLQPSARAALIDAFEHAVRE